MLKSQRRHGRSFLVILVSVASLRAGPSAAPSGQGTAGDTAVIPFTIRVTPDALRDLSSRLALTRLPDELAGAAWDYGMNLGFFKDLLAYWQKQFDWRAQERRLNQQFSQYMTRIDGLRIHFVHQRSLVPAARPLLLLNGWPSSMDEFSRVIGPLTDPVRYGGRAEDAFHVVIPSMPGYGFSDKVRDRGYGNQQIASLWSELMARLGYDRYGVVGSDIGIGVGTQLALMNASHITGLHLAGCGAAPRLLRRLTRRGTSSCRRPSRRLSASA
jgi:hypothetical protein